MVPTMFHVRNMTDEDIPFAVRLTDEMEWNMAPADFEFNMQLEPQGCFVLLDGSRRIGLITTISFDKIGWFGNLIVAKTHREKGAGTRLAKHAVDYLLSKNVKTVGIYSYIDKIPFYEKLGFKCESKFVVLKGRGFSSSAAKLTEARKEHMQEIVNLDQTCFGGFRRRLLERLLENPANSCYVRVEDGKMCGYAVAKNYGDMGELGSLVCSRGRGDVAIDLLKACLSKLQGLDVSICVPERERPILSLLMKSGFRQDFGVARMFFKPFVPADCIYLAESLERG